MANAAAKILVVDDDSVDFRIVSRGMKKHGIENEIVWSRDGEEGIAFLRQADPKTNFLVLLDLRMPRMSGYEFLEELRGDETLKQTVVFVLSSSNDVSDRDRVYDLGISGYLVKADTPKGSAGHAKLIETYLETVRFP